VSELTEWGGIQLWICLIRQQFALDISCTRNKSPVSSLNFREAIQGNYPEFDDQTGAIRSNDGHLFREIQRNRRKGGNFV